MRTLGQSIDFSGELHLALGQINQGEDVMKRLCFATAILACGLSANASAEVVFRGSITWTAAMKDPDHAKLDADSEELHKALAKDDACQIIKRPAARLTFAREGV